MQWIGLINGRKQFLFQPSIFLLKDGKFQFGLFDKRDSFPFSIIRMPDKSSNVPSTIVYSAIGAESLSLLEQVTPLNHSPQQLNHLLPVSAGRGYPLEK